jgi:iron complex transport system ATP-binding protein
MGRYPHLGPFELEGVADVEIARDALTATGTADLADRRFDTLSGGEKQRVVIASALAQAADLLLLDEPTASLDLAYQLEVGSLLRRLNRSRSTTMILSTHDLNLAAAVCHEVVLLREGRVVARGTVADTLTAASIRATYAVEADVQFHPQAGHLSVVPLARTR